MKENIHALSIVKTLNKNGFIAYFAGGYVRDLLLNHPSDDIDIATNAPPETIQAIFPHTVPIGIAFGIVLVIVEGYEFEVATFRQDMDYHDGRRPAKVEFCTPENDAKRRDFTINGMFYDPVNHQVIDLVEGKKDLEKKLIRAIGNPHERIKEDRLRMIRAIRLQCRLGFSIEEKTFQAILNHARELFPSVAIERVYNEFTKAHSFGKLSSMLIELFKANLLQTIFPACESLNLQEIEHRLKPTFAYPKNTPEIAIILALFQHENVQDDELICKKLKLANTDLTFTRYFHSFKAHFAKFSHLNDYEIAHLLANPLAPICLEIVSIGKETEKKQVLEKDAKLKTQIARICNKTPVVTAKDLENVGIMAGILMGKLLKEAEKIAIIEKIEDCATVIEKLKKTDLWPK